MSIRHDDVNSLPSTIYIAKLLREYSKTSYRRNRSKTEALKAFIFNYYAENKWLYQELSDYIWRYRPETLEVLINWQAYGVTQSECVTLVRSFCHNHNFTTEEDEQWVAFYRQLWANRERIAPELVDYLRNLNWQLESEPV